MNETTSINERNLKELLDAFEHYFPTDTVYVSDKPFKSFYGDYNWRSRKDFIDFIKRLTGVEIKNEKDIANIKLAQNKLVKLADESSKEKLTESNEPDKWTREAQEAERQKREAEIEKTKTEAQKQVERSIKTKQEVFEKQQKYQKIKEEFDKRIEKQKEIQTKLEGKKIYAKVIPPEPEEANDSTKKFIKEAKKHPHSFRKDLSSKLEEQITVSSFAKDLSKEEVQIIADKVSNDTISAINNPVAQVENAYQTAILNSIPKNDIISKTISDKSIQDFLNNASTEISFINNKDVLSRNILASFNENLASGVFGPDPQKINVLFFSKQEVGITHTVDLQQLNSGYGNFLNEQSQLFDRIGGFGQDELKGFLLGQARTFLDGQIAKLPADSFVSGFYNSSFGQQILNFAGLTEYTPLGGSSLISFAQQIPGATPIFEWIGNTLGINFTVGATTPVAEIAGTAVAATETSVTVAGSTTVATGVAATEAGTALASGAVAGISGAAGTAGGATAGAAMGSAVPVIGTIVGAIVGFVASKIPWDKIGKFLKEWGGVIGVGLLLGGGLLTSVPLMATGSLFLIAGLGAARSPALFLAGILIALKAILKPPVLQIGKSLIIIFVVIPIIVALFMFIINSGAYVVPPTVGIMGDTSPYIGIVKTPIPAGPFENTDLPKTITYEVVITAKKGPLTNVKIGYDCVVISSNKSNCPAITEIPTFVESISPSNPFTFTYTSTYDGAYSDSSIIDTIAVTADTSLQSGVMADGSASVTFGSPPISCPLPEGQPLNDMNYSYSAQDDMGHGSTKYWRMMGNPYHYDLPQHSGCTYPTDCPYYGYAYDVFPTTSIKTVYVPTVLGKETTWILSGSFTNPNAGYSLIYTDTTGNNTITLTHLNSPSGPKTAKSGTAVNTLFDQGGNTHLHIEFQMNGVWEKPELYFCQ